MHDLKKLSSLGYKVITSKELAERSYKHSIDESEQSPERFERFYWAFEIGLPSEITAIEAAAYKEDILKDNEVVDWSGATMLKPVTALEVASRIDHNLRGTGCRLVMNERCKDGSSVELRLKVTREVHLKLTRPMSLKYGSGQC